VDISHTSHPLRAERSTMDNARIVKAAEIIEEMDRIREEMRPTGKMFSVEYAAFTRASIAIAEEGRKARSELKKLLIEGGMSEDDAENAAMLGGKNTIKIVREMHG